MDWTHIRDTKRTARKQHVCELCRTAIVVGEQYVERCGRGEGKVEAFRMHVECEEISQQWDCMDWEVHSIGDIERPSPIDQLTDATKGGA